MNPQIQTPIIQGNYQAIRADHASGDRKGGVLISLPNDIKLLDSNEASLDGLAMEVLLTILRLPNGQSIHLTVVYRSYCSA